ncbi:F-box protein At2g02240-like [Humulus lupulus]|uniref:F-box protein At2g02240-like n=1 Tax=Humulus lupulus TaxID=3486 RepID=UPI002B403732|nr:F-box protein At2g02240-like [Humulus lupulus]
MEISQLPEECISLIISLTSPRDACRSALVSPLFRSVSDSDVVWERFLPPDYQKVISQAVVFPQTTFTKKSLYFHLSHYPILIGDGNMSFSVERESGKKCYMVGARKLDIAWGDTPQYWKWASLPDSRFLEVAILEHVWWLHVTAKLETEILSPKTTYAAYLVFKLEENQYNFDRRPVELRVQLERREEMEGFNAFLDPSSRNNINMSLIPRDRGDGWKEIEMGHFFNEDGEDGLVLCTLKEVSCSMSWSGLVVQGIELRPRAAA